ncbi:hypothetical protein CPB83DRAFT_846612 [Crepidotus variabilis]|uniref:Ribosome biogenesis protein NSA1 n=1 Tax=Crepidotus variabilis TaxID=179855 RepID=A0A9P6EQA1_9AGAR|nr:hypothetical protein CPB83DRAFT_846612 [Crepidotus variabilis]
MTRFLIGDELGNVKVLRYIPDVSADQKMELKFLHAHNKSAPARSVQRLTAKKAGNLMMLASSFSDGECSLAALSEDDELSIGCSWQEKRMKGSKFVGTSITESAVTTCTASGMLSRTSFNVEDGITISEHTTGTLPSRLFDWRQSPDGATFCYGGDEVDMSVWDAERTFHNLSDAASASTTPGSKKRKRNDDLFPAEIWRARNLPNDHLGLRQPVRISALAYLDSSANSHHLVAGTQFGDVRRYDTKSGRRPVSHWKGIAKVAGVKVVEKGFSEHEIFVADGGSSLYAVDVRTGGILNGYKGISGAVTSIASSPTFMASTSLDRFGRIHSTIAPPAKAGAHQEKRGEVLDKIFMNTTPTVVVWDQCTTATKNKLQPNEEVSEDDEEDTWNQMENIS